MAHKVLSADMANLVQAMKLAQEYATTLLDGEYRRGMLQAAHVLAVDAKHLLDTVDVARKRMTEGLAVATARTSSHARSLSSSSQSGFLSSGAPPTLASGGGSDSRADMSVGGSGGGEGMVVRTELDS